MVQINISQTFVCFSIVVTDLNAKRAEPHRTNHSREFDLLCSDFGMNAFMALRQEAKANGIQDMSLDEINELARFFECKEENADNRKSRKAKLKVIL